MTKKYKVTLYPSDSDVPVAEAYVDAADFETAHKRAISLIRAQFPDLDPDRYDHTLANEVLWKAPEQ